MKHYTELTKDVLESYNIETVLFQKRKEKFEYLNIEAGFDIETSSEYALGEKVAHMYIWMFGIGMDNEVYYGRTWFEFLECMQLVRETFDLTPDGRRLVIYVHNLSYEFQFIKHYFQWAEVFAMAKGSVLKALTTDGFEFRCSMKLSGSSLANVAKNLSGKYACRKAEGDLDYSLVRHSDTPLTDEEMGYCENDIVVVRNYIAKEIELYGNVGQLEMTNTGRVRTRIRNAFLYGGSKRRKDASQGAYARARELMDTLTMDADTYRQCKNTFQGGFTHSNPNHTWETLENISSYDLTSSYPTVMCAERFPMGSPMKLEALTVDEVKDLMGEYCVMFRAHFTGLKNKIGFESYFSIHKCAVKGTAKHANGRIFEAEEAVTYITDIDLMIAKNVYEWESVTLDRVVTFKKGYLPRPILEEILKMYSDKTTLKGVDGREDDYMLSKGMLNSTYGMCVTDPVKDEHTYTDDWEMEKANVEEKVEQYNNSKTRALYYPWGIWVTAYARRNLWLAILNIKEDYVYADTDSVKFMNPERHERFFEQYNVMITNKLEAMCEEMNLDKEMLCPQTIKGEKAPLGVWDYEGNYTRFKTLGAKRYLVEHNGKLKLTVAGLSKQNGLNYMKEIADGETQHIFNLFNDGLFIPADKTGKMTHTNVEGEKRFVSTDYLGSKRDVTTLSGMHLEPASFDMSMTDDYKFFIRNMAEGYTYNGDEFTL